MKAPRIFRPDIPGADRMVLEIERELQRIAGRTGFISSAPVTADATLAESDGTVLVDATAGAVVLALPAAASAIGRIYTIKKTDASLNTVTIDPNGAETIDGAATVILVTQFQSRTIQSDGAQWWVL